MPERPESVDARAAWLDQPGDETPIDIEQIRSRRTRELFSTTRSEIVGSIAAALFFAAVLAWRFGAEQGRLVQFGCAAVVLWAAITAFRFRDSIRPRPAPPDALARTGLEHYRAELQRRRDHLRSEWVWHGPLLLACAVAVAALAQRAVPRRLTQALPLLILLLAWVITGVVRRRRQAARVQREINEIQKEVLP